MSAQETYERTRAAIAAGREKQLAEALAENLRLKIEVDALRTQNWDPLLSLQQANLRRAAPQMLIALQCAAQALDALHPEGGTLVHPTPKQMVERTLAVINEAVAKAEGR